METPKDKNYGKYDIQCGKCNGEGEGCGTCHGRGWLSSGHPDGKTCARPGCHKPLRPYSIEEYCTDECARKNAA